MSVNFINTLLESPGQVWEGPIILPNMSVENCCAHAAHCFRHRENHVTYIENTTKRYQVAPLVNGYLSVEQLGTISRAFRFLGSCCLQSHNKTMNRRVQRAILQQLCRKEGIIPAKAALYEYFQAASKEGQGLDKRITVREFNELCNCARKKRELIENSVLYRALARVLLLEGNIGGELPKQLSPYVGRKVRELSPCDCYQIVEAFRHTRSAFA